MSLLLDLTSFIRHKIFFKEQKIVKTFPKKGFLAWKSPLLIKMYESHLLFDWLLIYLGGTRQICVNKCPIILKTEETEDQRQDEHLR